MGSQLRDLLGGCLAIVVMLFVLGKMAQVYSDVMAKWGRVEMFSRRHLRRSLVFVLAILIWFAIAGLIWFVFIGPMLRTALR